MFLFFRSFIHSRNDLFFFKLQAVPPHHCRTLYFSTYKQIIYVYYLSICTYAYCNSLCTYVQYLYMYLCVLKLYMYLCALSLYLQECNFSVYRCVLSQSICIFPLSKFVFLLLFLSISQVIRIVLFTLSLSL